MCDTAGGPVAPNANRLRVMARRALSLDRENNTRSIFLMPS